jgi:hypothetical protein
VSAPTLREQTHGEAYERHDDRKPKGHRELTGFFNAAERDFFCHVHDLRRLPISRVKVND